MYENQNQLTADSVIDGLKRLVAMNQNNVDATLDYLEISPKDRGEAKRALEGLLVGDEVLHAELSAELSSLEGAGDVEERGGGKTGFKVLRKWGIRYGFRLYLAHDIVENATDIGALVAAVAACCGPQATPLVAGIAIAIAALKALDRGKGITITQIPPVVGPCIPTPQ
jgi:hypothetical protein